MQDNFDEKFHPGCPVFDQRSKKMAVTRRAVLLPTEGAEATLSPDVRGGKGANLADMAALRLPVPPFFTIPTGICRAYMEHGELPKRTKWHLERGIAELEKATGREFGSPNNPLLVSVRSGAPVSMPGMMDTVLNVGMTQKAEDGLAAMGGEEFATDILIRFLQSFGCHGWPDVTPWEQLNKSITDVLDSWNSERAKAYREAHGIPDWIGTAVNVQAMVFGNLDDNSGTGVAFSTNPSTGEDGMFGEWLSQAQGEDIVSGARTPEPICNLAAKMPAVYAELEGYVEMLSAHVGGVADVEFTVEAGKLYVLQVRRAKVSPVAAATMAVRAQWAKQISREEAVASLTEHQIRQLRTDSFSPRVLELAMHHYLVATGLPASPGAAVGLVVYSSQEAVEAAKQGIDVVLVRPDTSPDDLLGMLAAKAIVTGTGGMTCHAAMVASAQGIPAVVGVGELPALWPGAYLSVDATNGRVFQGQLPLIRGERTKEVNIFLKWAAQMKPSPSLDFSLLEQRFCMNQVLNDFYLVKRMAQASAGSSLEGEAAEMWRKTRDDTAVLMGTYLSLSMGRELRHTCAEYLRSLGEELVSSRPADKLVRQLVGNDWDEVHARDYSIEQLSMMDLGEQTRFAELAAKIFALPNWGSRGTGGKPWAAIAEALLAYLDGSWEFDTFVDHAFDLRHHGGVLFNKHPVVNERTGRSRDKAIPKQLDAKRDISDIRVLRSELVSITSPLLGSEPYFGAKVDNLWSKGEQLGLW
jgi:pyruvate,orthophosphate dikinase